MFNCGKGGRRLSHWWYEICARMAHRSAQRKILLQEQLHSSFHFFGLLITKEEDGIISVSAVEKLQAITTHLISRQRRKEENNHLNVTEAHGFASINGSMCFLGKFSALLHHSTTAICSNIVDVQPCMISSNKVPL